MSTVKRKRGRPKKNPNEKKEKPRKRKTNTIKSKKYSLLNTQKPPTQKITESVLVHLPINIEKFQKKNVFYDNEFFNYDAKQLNQEPLPYDPKSNNENNLYENIVKEDDKNEKETDKNEDTEYNIYNGNDYINKKVKTILVQFNDFNKIQQWPNSTDIKCWWCCHNFDNSPCGIPIKIENDTFHVYGCFCSFNCALSYNFSSDTDKKWERAGLINLLFNKTFNNTDEVNYAPNRACLKEFGGYLSIEEFRNNTENINYNITYPPMLSIIPQIEEIKVIKETNRENDFMEKLQLVSEKMKIKNRKQNQKNLSIFLKSKTNI
jgi:hypothetical protein